MKNVVKNIAKCAKCGDIIESKHLHDFVRCRCGAIAVDGGNDYIRRCGNPEDFDKEFDYENGLIATEEPAPIVQAFDGAKSKTVDMNDNWMPKTLKGVDLAPQFCENEHEFYKFYALLTTMISPDSDDRMFFSIGVRILLHEYLALVVGGKMDPYEVGSADKEDKERFRMAMAKYTEILQEMGVPFKEEDNGVMAFDYDEVERRARDES